MAWHWVLCWFHGDSHLRSAERGSDDAARLGTGCDVPFGRLDGENGVPIAQSKGVKFLRMQGRRAVFEIGSGRYDFVSDMAKSVAGR